MGASAHALDAKVFAAQAIFESEISATAAKEAKEELAEITKLKEDMPSDKKTEGVVNEKKEQNIDSMMKDISTGEKMEGEVNEKKEQNIGTAMIKDVSVEEKIEVEGNEKKEENIGSIQKEIEEAAEKTKEAADDALVAKLMAEKHVKPLNE